MKCNIATSSSFVCRAWGRWCKISPADWGCRHPTDLGVLGGASSRSSSIYL